MTPAPALSPLRAAARAAPRARTAPAHSALSLPLRSFQATVGQFDAILDLWSEMGRIGPPEAGPPQPIRSAGAGPRPASGIPFIKKS